MLSQWAIAPLSLKWLHQLLEDVLLKVSSLCPATMLVFLPEKLARGGASFDCRALAA